MTLAGRPFGRYMPKELKANIAQRLALCVHRHERLGTTLKTIRSRTVIQKNQHVHPLAPSAKPCTFLVSPGFRSPNRPTANYPPSRTAAGRQCRSHRCSLASAPLSRCYCCCCRQPTPQVPPHPHPPLLPPCRPSRNHRLLEGPPLLLLMQLPLPHCQPAGPPPTPPLCCMPAT